MSDEIRALNAQVKLNNNIGISTKDNAIIKEEQDKLSKLMSNLSAINSDDLSINQNKIDIKDLTKTTSKKSFIQKIFDKFTSNNKTPQITKEVLEAIADIEQMACIPQ